jgi:hypothetical protein
MAGFAAGEAQLIIVSPFRILRRANIPASPTNPPWRGVKSEWVFNSGCKRGLPSRGVCRRPGLSADSTSTEELSAIAEPERNQTHMSTVIQFIAQDVHRETVSVSIARSNSIEIRIYGNIGGAFSA